jgi:sporulation protein YlmC with PRC-barrel domain
METQFVLGTTARCSDGTCGMVHRMILDPDTRTVTHLVIGPRHWSADDRLVPVALVDATAGEISLRCTMAEFDRLAPAEEVQVVDDIGFDGGMGIGVGVGGVPQTIIDDAVPPGETDLVRHERVHATDGEIGQIEGFVVNHGDHKVTHLLLKEGHLWAHKEVAIPVSAVASMENGIWLNITKQEVEDLPARDRP